MRRSKILCSLAPIYKVLVSRRVSVLLRENSAQHLLLSHVYWTHLNLIHHYLWGDVYSLFRIENGVKMIQNHPMKLFFISSTEAAPALIQIPSPDWSTHSAGSFADSDQWVFVFVLAFFHNVPTSFVDWLDSSTLTWTQRAGYTPEEQQMDDLTDEWQIN